MSRPEMSDHDLDAALRSLPPREAGPHPDDAALLALRAGRLDATAAATVEGHLAACVDCRRLWADMVAPTAAAEVERAASAPRQPAARRWAPWLGVAMAAGLAFGVGAVLPGGAPSEPPTGEGASMPDWQWYRPGRPQGGVAELRGAEPQTPTDVPARYMGFSELSLRIDVDPAAPALVTPTSAAFVAEGDTGPLRAMPPGHLKALEGGGLLLRGQADALLGATPGPRRVFIVLGGQAASLEGVEVADVQSRAAVRGLKVFEFPVVLVSDTAR